MSTIPHSLKAQPKLDYNQYAKKILLVSHYCPTRAHAGGLRILDIYKLIREELPQVQLDLLTYHRPSIDWNLDDVHAIFHNIYLSKCEQLTPEILKTFNVEKINYDVIDLQFHESGMQANAFRKIGKKIIFTPMECLSKAAYLSLKTNYFSWSLSKILNNINIFRKAYQEIRITLMVDEVVCVSQSDASFLSKLSFSSHILGLDTGISTLEFSEPLANHFELTDAQNRRCNVLYVAYFGSSTNTDALKWYLDHVHKKIRENVPGYVFTVVGRGDLSAFSSYIDESIEFVGEVPALAPYIKEAGVGIAPALSGSGFRGKVNQYAIYGIPGVVTTIAHKGLVYQDGENILIADKPEKFVEHCIKLLRSHELNNRIGQAARELCLKTYTWQSKWSTVKKIYNLENEKAE